MNKSILALEQSANAINCLPYGWRYDLSKEAAINGATNIQNNLANILQEIDKIGEKAKAKSLPANDELFSTLETLKTSLNTLGAHAGQVLSQDYPAMTVSEVMETIFLPGITQALYATIGTNLPSTQIYAEIESARKTLRKQLTHRRLLAFPIRPG